MKNTALYIGTDPLTFNDNELILKCISIFGFIFILLDRKNKDAEYDKYYLSYADRADIIKHDLVKQKDHFLIIPIDLTVLLAIQDNDINNLVLNIDYQKESSFRMYNTFKKTIPNVNIICLGASNFLGNHCLPSLLQSDSSMKLHSNICSDYSYAKFKVKTTKKIGITGNIKTHIIGQSIDCPI